MYIYITLYTYPWLRLIYPTRLYNQLGCMNWMLTSILLKLLAKPWMGEKYNNLTGWPRYTWCLVSASTQIGLDHSQSVA